MRGNTLFQILLFILFAGLMMVGITKMADLYFKIEKPEITENNLDSAYNALLAYYAKNGEYPCPAPINASVDTKGFGVSAAACISPSAGIQIVKGAKSKDPIAVGALPTRTLGIPDGWGFDSYSKRLLYVVTAAYTDANDALENAGAIDLVDRNGNAVTNDEESIIFTLIGYGEENQGAYSFDGVLVEPCDPSSFFGENCDGDGVFTHSASAIDIGKEAYVSKIRYKVEDACKMQKNIPRKAGFLLDTSGSMRKSSHCPPEGPGKCTRMKLALWALHRTMAARMQQLGGSSDDDAFTGFSGFTGSSSTSGALAKMKSRNVEIKEEGDVAKQIYKSCPKGMTPLGVHIEAMAKMVTDGDKDRPNVITVISDGFSNRGTDPVTVAKRIKKDMPNLKVNIVDVHGTPSLKQVAKITGGEYFRTNKPDELLDALYVTMGVCPEKQFSAPKVKDETHCQK
ncbi:MAG: hypothetical protein MRY79_06250 [Alphaproteobacteria bacterium]|nr:hypothetical protein [Alphaproteobacteria bacterium]